MPPWETLVELMLDRAAELPDKPAYTFLEDGENEERTWTYSNLDRHARAVAVQLLANGVEPGDRVLLLYPPGLDFIAGFFGCLAAGVIAVPCYPPGTPDLANKAAGIAKDCGAKVALTISMFEFLADNPEGDLAWLANLKVLATDGLDAKHGDAWKYPNIGPDTLAFLQYTSGSTSYPKGVMVTHSNILANEEMIKQGFSHSTESTFVGWLPLYHDMGLIGNVLQPFYISAPSILMSPDDFLKRPIRWLKAISKYRAHTSGSPNFGYDLCVRKIKPEDRVELDLSSWRVAYNGAEPIRAETLDRFVEAFGACGFRRSAFYPCYGLAEATLFVTGGVSNEEPKVLAMSKFGLENHILQPPHDFDDETQLVGCGRTWQGLDLRIVNPETCHECPPDEIGEIWVRGSSVATGYWERSDLTQTHFHAKISGDTDGNFLRTGDYGIVSRNELFVTGRLKDLIVISGKNIYPQDLEHAVEQIHPLLRPGCGAAFSISAFGEERLVLIQEVSRKMCAEEVQETKSLIQSRITRDFGLKCFDVVFLTPRSIPKTSSGKVRRQECRTQYLTGQMSGLTTNVAIQDLSSDPTRQTLRSTTHEVS